MLTDAGIRAGSGSAWHGRGGDRSARIRQRAGLDGIRYVLESSKNLPIDFFIMLPSCVPATHLETAGARFTADDLALMIADDRIAGVAELMNYPGVYLGMESELAKIHAGKGKAIDGHAPGLRGKNLNAYALAGVRSDHESHGAG